jgi:hypothetical protein
MGNVMTSENATKLQPASIMGGDAATPGDKRSDVPETGAAPAETGPAPAPARTGAKKDVRFHIFVIDTRWNCAASKVLHEHLDILTHLNIDDELYVLDRATSIALLRYHPLQVGRDPIIAVHDLRPRHQIKHTHGFRMHLGSLDTERQVLATLRMFARFLVTHRNADDLDALVRQDLHSKGLAGAIQILGGHEHHKMIE